MPKTLGKYELIARVGQGAMGEVYKARDPFIGRLVALKTITSGLAGRPDLLDRFYQEARSSGTLQHPNIVTIYELGEEKDVPFIAMEFLEGESLDKLIDQRPTLPLSQKLGYIIPVCHALVYAHKRRIIHRDIKPGNVMLTTDGVVKVVDFGIARALDDSNTQTNMLIGTLGYMSPQQIRGQRADERSDIWALGILLYEILCYERPFTGTNHAALMMNIVDENISPSPLREKISNCPSELDAFIGKMLQKDADQRFQTMEEVLLDLEPLWKRLQEETVSELVVDGEKRISAQDLPGAQDLLKKALQINSSNTRAKSLLEKINQQIKQGQVLQQAQSQLARAASLLEQGLFQEAVAEAEGALKFGSLFAPDHEVFAEARRIAEQARLVEQRFQASKQRLAAGALTEAGQELEEALKLKGNSAELRALQKQIQDQVERRKERERLASGLQQARMFWAERRYDECITLLTGLQKEFPHEQEILKLLETVRSDQVDLQRQQKLADARGLLATQRFEDALNMIAVLQQEHPSDEAVIDLRTLIVQAQEEFSRRQRFQAEMEKLRSLLHAGNRSEAVSLGEKLLQEFPQEPELAELLEFARDEEEKHQLESIVKEVRGKINAQEFQRAIASGEEGLRHFPGNAELTALISEAARLAERNQLIQHHLRTINKLVGEGALTEAQKEIEKALGLEADSVQFRALQKQIQDQIGRRKERDRLAAAVQQSRICWAEQRYDECISLLTGIQKEFPREQDVIKLLETARNDQAQQLKRGQLAKARDLLAGQKFEEALKIIGGLQKQHAGDRAVQNLQTLILEAQEEYKKQQRYQSEMEKLRTLVSDTKFAEAVADGERLRGEFPNEPELTELVSFARGEKIRIEKKGRLDEQLKLIKQMIKDGRFSAAIQSTQQALAEYPQNTDLLILLDRAKRDQAAKEKRELLGKRLKEIQQRINREELSDAVDLARQTQVTVGPDPAIADLLHKAEWELVQRKRYQNEAVQKAKALLESGSLDEATLILQNAVGTQLFPKSDARVNELLEEIEKKKAEVSRSRPARISPPRPPAGGSDSWPHPTIEPAKDYVYRQGMPLPESPDTPSQDTTSAVFSTATQGTPSAPDPTFVAPVEKDTPSKSEEEKPPGAAPSTLEEFTATKVSPPNFEKRAASFQLPEPGARLEKDLVTASRAKVPEKPRSQLWLVGVAVGLVILAIGVYRFRQNPSTVTSEVVSQPRREQSGPQVPLRETPSGIVADNAAATANGVPGQGPPNPKLSTENFPPNAAAKNFATNAPIKAPPQPMPSSNSLANPVKTTPARPIVETRTQPPGGDKQVLTPVPVAPQPPQPKSEPVGPPPEVNSPMPNTFVPSASTKVSELSATSSSSAPAPSAVQPAVVSAPNVAPAKPAEPVSTAKTVDSPDLQAIHNVIQQLSSALSSRSMNELQGIWPKMGPNKNALKKVFDSAQSLSREFHIANTTIHPDGASATVVGNYEGQIREGGREFPSSGNFYVRLSKKDGKWFIDDASF